MDFIEITGQPCSGKTSFITQRVLAGVEFQAYEQGYKIKVLNFFKGIRYLGISRTKVLFAWSLKEKTSLFFRLNIFRNAVSKFGLFRSLNNSKSNISKVFLVDEGLSHLPFLFPKTETLSVLCFMSEELKKIDVTFLRAPGNEVIKERLQNRGHKRLKFTSLQTFIKRNNEIEGFLLKRYPNLCAELKVSEYAQDI